MLEVGSDALIEFEGAKGTAVVRGWRMGEGGYVLTEKPTGKIPSFSPGKEAVVRIRRNGTLYGATVKFQEHLRKTNLCYLAFSQEMITISLRKLERVSCVLPVTLRLADGDDAPIKGVVVDLSLGGVKIITHAKIDEKDWQNFTISLNPGGMGSVTGLKLSIVRAESQNERFEYCGQFPALPEHGKKLMEAYLNFCKTWTE
jgi:hypothetical protein